ncbi:MAG: 4Fe-4S binding protein [Spirochaetes bacterium]|nr:4Fe-4S binding protein [Spirochaetota bacterium]
MKESTRIMFRKHGLRIDRAVHNYIYFVFYYPYVRTMYHALRFLSEYLYWCRPLKPLLRAAFDRYHSKVLSSGNAAKLLSVKEDLRAVSDRNRRIVPFRYAYGIILQEAQHIAVMDCPCKKTLGDEEWAISSCIALGKGLAGFWLDHGEKYRARRITRDEALAMVRMFRERGYLTQAFFKVATGGSTGVICNCHPDSCVSLKATAMARRFGGNLTMNAASGYSVLWNPKKCRFCGTCMLICPVEAVDMRERERRYRREECLGCELCVEHCRHGALSLYRDEEKPVPLDIDIVKREYL